jgi:hypothetical protein
MVIDDDYDTCHKKSHDIITELQQPHNFLGKWGPNVTIEWSNPVLA